MKNPMKTVYFDHPDFGLCSLGGVTAEVPEGSKELSEKAFEKARAAELKERSDASAASANKVLEKRKADMAAAGFTADQIALLAS